MKFYKYVMNEIKIRTVYLILKHQSKVRLGPRLGSEKSIIFRLVLTDDVGVAF